MALAHVHFRSAAIEKQVAMSVLLPDAGAPPFTTLYLFHGLSDDHTTWLRRTRLEWVARELPLMIVMPDGFRGFYIDNDAGPAYGQYLADELPAFVERNFPARPTRDGRCVGGLSMGGYGAIQLALRRPDRYSSAHSHSGALLHGSRPWPAGARPEFTRIFGPDPRGSERDLLHLAEKARSAGALPRLRIDCGQDDYLIDDNRAFHRRLEEIGLPHEYHEPPGRHDWDYWDRHVLSALRFHLA